MKTDVIPKKLVFIDSMQFTNSSLEKLVKNLPNDDFEYLIKEIGSKNLELKQNKKMLILMSTWTILKDLVKKKTAKKRMFLQLCKRWNN